MPLFGHSKRVKEADDYASSPGLASGSPDFDQLLQHFRELSLAQRAAEVLEGISSQLPRGERSAMDRLLIPGFRMTTSTPPQIDPTAGTR